MLTDLLLLAFSMVFSSLASSSSYTGCTNYTSCINCIDCIDCAYTERSASIARISAPSSAHYTSVTTLKINNKRSASIARISAPSSTHCTSIKTLIIVLDRFDTDLITWPKVEISTKSVSEVYLNR